MSAITNKLYISLIFCLSSYFLISQSGIVDVNFGNGGKIITDFDQQNDQFESVLFLKDSSIIQYGYSEKGTISYITLIKNSKDGAIDVNFGNNGKLLIRAEISFIKLFELEEDKIQIVSLKKLGSSLSLLSIRLNGDGTLDKNFSDDGVLIVDNFISGELYSENLIERMTKVPTQYLIYIKSYEINNPIPKSTLKLIDINTLVINDLSFISEFGILGVIREQFFVHQDNIYKLLHDEKGYIYILKYNKDGVKLNHFGSNSILKFKVPVSPDFLFDIISILNLEYSESKVLLAIKAQEYLNNINRGLHYLIRLDTLGNLDNKFGIEGIVLLDTTKFLTNFSFHPLIALQEQKILISLSYYNGASKVISNLLRIDENGKLDESFPLKDKYPANYHLSDSSFFLPRFIKILVDKLYIGSVIDNKENSMDFFLARFNLNPVPTLIKSENFSRKLFIVNNPIKEELYIRFKDEVLHEDSQLQIIDMNANILHTEKIRAIDFKNQLKIDLSFIPSGQYIVCLRNSKGNYHNKFIKL